MRTYSFWKCLSDLSLMTSYWSEALCEALPSSYSRSSHDVFMSLILRLSPHLFCQFLSLFLFLTSLFSSFFSADARCGDGRQWLGAEVYRGDVGRGAQPGAHRAADTHGRGQSLHISVELTVLVASVPKSVLTSSLGKSYDVCEVLPFVHVTFIFLSLWNLKSERVF